jgi:hypothetical protein
MSVVALAAAVAPKGAADARTRREHGCALDGVGQEDYRAPDDLDDDDEIRGCAGTQSRPTAPAGATALRRARAVSCRPTGAGDLLHASCRLTEDLDGRHTSLTPPETDPPLGGCRGPAHQGCGREQPPGVGARPQGRSGEYQSSPPHLGSAGRACHGPLGRWESRIPEAYPRGSEMGLPICRKF